MDVYNLKTDEAKIPHTRGYRMGLRVYYAKRIYQVLVVLLAVLHVIFILRNLSGSYEPSGEHFYLAVSLLFISEIVSLLLFFLTFVLASAWRAKKQDLLFRRDYNLALYRRMYGRRYTTATTEVLVRLACQEISRREYDLAVCALSKLSTKYMNITQAKLGFLCRAAVAFLTYRGNYKEQLSHALVFGDGKVTLSDEELKQLFTPGTDEDTFLEGFEKVPVSKHTHFPFLCLFGAVLFWCSGWFYAGETLLPAGYYYRTPFAMGGLAILWLCWTLMGIAALHSLWNLIKQSVFLRKGERVLCRVILIVFFTLGVFIYGGWSGMRMLFGYDTEVAVMDDGMILMETTDYDPTQYYSQSVGPFLRHDTTAVVIPGQTGEDASESGSDSANSTDMSESGSEASSADASDRGEQADVSGENSISGSDGIAASEGDAYADSDEAEEAARLSKEMMAIRQYLIDTGALADADAENVEFQTSAKGSLYVIFDSGTEDGIEWQKRLVYDRVSENGDCDLFVYYIDRTDASGSTNTGILEFYAVRISGQEVIPGGKSGWSDPGTQVYRDATGE